MAFRNAANIDNNQHKGLVASNSIDNTKLVLTGLSLTNAQPLHVAIVDSSGSQVTSFGGGTQYTDGGVPPTHPIGPTLEFNNAGTWVTVGSSNPLPITGSLSVGGTVDEAVFIAGTSTFSSSGGVFNDSVATLSSGQQGAQRLTPNRALHTNLRNNAGTEIGTSSTPIQVSLANTSANATAVKVDGSAVTQPVSLTSTSITGNVTVAQATAASLNSTVTQGPAASITGGWVTIAGETADTTGTFTNATQTTSVTATSLSGYQAATVSINGTYGTATAVFEGSDDGGTTWYSLQAGRTDSGTIETGYASLTNNTRMWTLEITGLDSFRVRSTAVASGTVNVRISISASPTADASVVSIGTALPTGANTIGAVTSNPAVASAIINNQQTVTTSSVALATNTLTQGITVEALSTNTVSVFIGASGVTTTTGLELAPGSAVTLPVNNSNLVFVRCASGSPVVTWVAV